MNSDIPECRTHPWLFLNNESYDATNDTVLGVKGPYLSGSTHATLMVKSSDPFEHPDVTCQDVLTLLSLGYELTEVDRSDIARNMHMDEILKLSEYITLNLSYVSNSNPTYSREYHSIILKDRLSLTPRIVRSVWDMRIISRNIDISEILRYPNLPWNLSSLSYNPSVCLEHVQAISSMPNITGSFYYPSMLERSDPDHCIFLIGPIRDLEYLRPLSKNPRLRSEHIRILCNHCCNQRDIINNILQYSDISEIVKCIQDGSLQYIEGYRLWINRSILKYDNPEDVLACINPPPDQVHIGIDLETLELLHQEWEDLPEITREILIHHPFITHFLDPHNIICEYVTCIQNFNVQSLVQSYIREGHAIDDELLRHPEVTLDHLRGLEQPSCSDVIAPWLTPEELIEITKGDTSYRSISVCKSLKIDRLNEYMIPEVIHGEYIDDEISNIDELIQDLKTPRHLRRQRLKQYGWIVLPDDQWLSDSAIIEEILTHDQLRYHHIGDLLDSGYISVDKITNRLDRMNITCEDLISLNDKYKLPQHEVNRALLSNDSSYILISETGDDQSMRSWFSHKHDFLRHNYPLDDSGILVYLTNIIQSTLSHRLYRLHRLGYTDCVKNCLLPLTFSNRSLQQYSDIDIIASS
uniref:Uncharacterized protein n=1 Tax=viral metagenome TaxID=1070528 RepID=A0A6C0BNF8_9ZZZZ